MLGRRLLLLALPLLLAACSPSAFHPFGHPSPAPASANVPSGVPCADLVAKAMTSPHVVVTGVSLCLDQAATAQAAGWHTPVTDDASFANYAASPPIVTHFVYVKTSNDYLSYRLDNPQTGQAFCLGILMAGPAPTGVDNRQVDIIGFARVGSGLCSP